MNLDTPEFLHELHHLFSSPPGKTEDGKADWGFNCYAKAFVVMYLCRLRGMQVDVCLGELFIMQKAVPEKYAIFINPHAWVGSPKERVIDLSLADVGGNSFLPVFHDRVGVSNGWIVGTTLKKDNYEKVTRDFRDLPNDSYMLYFLKQNRLFVFDDICNGVDATNSPPTKKLGKIYGDNNVLA